MTLTVAPPQSEVPRTVPLYWRLFTRAVALVPLWLYLIFSRAGGFGRPMSNGQPEAFGVPTDLLLIAFAAGLTLIGVGLVWEGRPLRTVVLAHVLFTLPATIMVIFGPALILIVQNLGT